MTRTISMLSGLAVAAILSTGMAAPVASQAFKSNKAGQRSLGYPLKLPPTHTELQREAPRAGRSGPRRSTTAEGVGKLTGNKRPQAEKGIIIYDIQGGDGAMYKLPPPKKKPDTSKDDCMSCD